MGAEHHFRSIKMLALQSVFADFEVSFLSLERLEN